MKQEFLALKWVIAEQIQEYLLWKPFIVRTDNNLLTYIMTTPNLDVTQHWWIESLVRFTFSIEYQKGWDNAAADALSWVTLKLDAETIKSILDGVIVGMMERANAQDLAVAKADEEIHKQVRETVILARATQAHVNLHVTDWMTVQQEDPILKTTIKRISSWKVQDLKHLLGDDANTEEGKTILWEQKKLILYHRALYHCHTPTGKLEEFLWLVVPMACQIAPMNGCHQDAGHQGSAANPVLATWSGSGGQEWLCRYRGWSATVSDAYSMKVTCAKDPNVTHHCYCTFGVATHWLYQHWDNYGSWINPWMCSKPFGLLLPLYKTDHGICDPPIKLWRLLLNFFEARIYLYLQSTGQAPEWLRSQLWKQHHQRA